MAPLGIPWWIGSSWADRGGRSYHFKRFALAKKSAINKQKRREKLVRRYAAKREEFKRRARDLSLSAEDRQAAREQLAKLPRNSSPVRLRTRCIVSGRPRAVYRKFMLSRIAFRELALEGKLPGIMKASW